MYNEENEKINAEENADFTENDVNEENVSVSDEDLYDDGDDFDGGIDADDFDAGKNYDKDDIKYLHQPSELLSRRTARAEKWKRVRENRISFKDFTHSRLFKILLTVICAIAAVFAIVYTVCIVTLPSDTVSRNVYVENINVSGLSYDNALAAIKNAYLLGEQKIVLSCGGETYSVNGADVALTASPEETAKMAFEYGKSGNKLKDGFTAFSLLFKKRFMRPAESFY